MIARLLTRYNQGVKVPGRRDERRPGCTSRSQLPMLVQSSLPFSAPEEWRPIPRFDGRYEVSNRGRVRSVRFRNRWGEFTRPEPRLLRGSPGSHGYPVVTIDESPRQVHRLVLEAFVGPCPDGYEGSHLNGIRSDVRLVNLCWETTLDNNRRQAEHGTIARGERQGAAKLTATQVIEIRAARARGEALRSVAARYGVGVAVVSEIARRKAWAHVP